MQQNIIMIAAITVYAVIVAAIGGTAYVLRSLGLYRLAKNRGFDNAWLAWIPVGDVYIMGKLAELSPYVQRKIPKLHIIMPIIYGAYLILCFVPSAIMIAGPAIFGSSGLGFMSVAAIGVFALLMIFMLVIVAALVFVYYHLFKVYDPNNAVLYTVLSALSLSFIFLFIIRNREPADLP